MQSRTHGSKLDLVTTLRNPRAYIDSRSRRGASRLSKTIILRDLPPNTTIKDITEELKSHGIISNEITLNTTFDDLKYALVEFPDLADAVHFMKINNHTLFFKQKHEIAMSFAEDRKFGWFCGICKSTNFKKRNKCFKCLASKEESEIGGAGFDEVSIILTKTIMLRNLDPLTIENTIITALESTITKYMKYVIGVNIKRENSISVGVCYITTDSDLGSLEIYSILSKNPFFIDGKQVMVSYCKYHGGDHSQPYIKEKTVVSATKTNKKEEMEYEDWKNRSNKESTDVKQYEPPTGDGSKWYPTPEISKFVPDQKIGYLYDPSTGLFYEPNSQYFWNPYIQKYLYWDQTRMTYLLVKTNEAKPKKVGKKNRMKLDKNFVKNLKKWTEMRNQNEERIRTKLTGSGNLENRAEIKMEDWNNEDNNGIEFLDYEELKCLLCNRRLPSKEMLTKHMILSKIHRQNLEAEKTGFLHHRENSENSSITQ